MGESRQFFYLFQLCLSVLLYIKCLCFCLLGPPTTQVAPLLECRCCHCHTCTTHRPSFLPLHSVSPGVQVLLFSSPFLNLWSPHNCLQPRTSLPSSSDCFDCCQGATVHFFTLLFHNIISLFSPIVIFLSFFNIQIDTVDLLERILRHVKACTKGWDSVCWCLVVSF